MVDQTVSVQILADVSSIMDGLRQAQQAATEAFSAISESSQAAIGSMGNFETQMSGASDQMRQAGESGQTAAEGVRKLGNVLETGLRATGVLIAAEAVKQLGEEISKLTESAVQISNMSAVLGVSTDQFQAMNVAASEAGISSDQFAHGAERMAEMLTKAREGSGEAIEQLKALGLTTDQIQSSTFGMNDLLQVLHERLINSATSAQTAAELQKELGIRYGLVSQALREYDGSAEAVAKVIGEINGLTPKQIESLKETHHWWEQTWTAIENASSKLVVWTSDAWDAVSATQAMVAVNEAELNAPAAMARVEQLQAATAAAKEAAAQQQAAAQAAAAAEIDAAHKAEREQIESQMAIVETFKRGTAERVQALALYDQEVAKYYGSGDVDKVRAANAQLIAAVNEYNQARVEAAQKAYQNIEEARKNTTELEERSIKEMLGQWEQYFKALDEDAKKSAEATRQTAVAGIEAARASLVASGQDKSAELAQEQSLIGQEIVAWHEYYDNLRALAQSNAAELRKLDAEELAETQKLAKEAAKLQADAAKQVESDWLSVMRPIGAAFDQMIEGMISHSKNLHQALQHLESQMLGDVIKWTTEELEKWAAKELAKKGLTLASLTGRKAAEESAMVEGQVAQKAAGTATILTDAAVAAAGTFAAIAAIPYVGPFLAPEMAAASYAEVSAMTAGLSASQGGIVPYEATNYHLHEGEMVLPRDLSQGFQEMLRGGGGGGGGGGGNFAIQAVDAKSFERMLNNPTHRNALLKAVRRGVSRNRSASTLMR